MNPFGYFETMTEAYPQLIDGVLRRGDHVSPDGKPTLELLGATFTVGDIVTGGVPIGIGRKVGPKPMAIDGLGNLSGQAFPKTILATGPFMERFSDVLTEADPVVVQRRSGVSKTGETFWQGTYGPRMASQVHYVESELRRDPRSRRAVINVWDSDTDYYPRYRDRPCTTQIQFLLREDGLHLFVTMRSNDLWTGTAYDVWQFGQLQQAMAHVLGVEVGPYHHHAVSLHAYQTDWDKLEAIDGTPVLNERETPGPNWYSIKAPYHSMGEVQTAFASIGRLLERGEQPKPANPVEAWYLAYLKPAGGGE